MAKLGPNMTYIESNKIDRLTKAYIDAKRNPKEILSEEAQDWRDQVCRPTSDDPYGDTLPFPEAYEKYILPKLPHERREDLGIILERIPEGKVPVITLAVEEEKLLFTVSDYKLLLERLDRLELEVSMLKSQNAFADVVGK